MTTVRHLVSVVVPTFNRQNLLIRAVRSVLDQTYGFFELLLVDDGSLTPSQREQMERLDRRIKVLGNDRTRGAAGARNAGVAAAKGTLISFLDDDDEFDPRHLERTVALFSQAEPRFSWCSATLINYDSETARDPVVTYRDFATEYPTSASLYQQLFTIGIGFGVTVDRASLIRVGGFDEALLTVEDTDLFVRLLSADVRPFVISERGIVLHNHSGPRMTDARHHRTRAIECKGLVRTHKEFFGKYPGIAAQLMQYADSLENTAGELGAAQACESNCTPALQGVGNA